MFSSRIEESGPSRPGCDAVADRQRQRHNMAIATEPATQAGDAQVGALLPLTEEHAVTVGAVVVVEAVVHQHGAVDRLDDADLVRTLVLRRLLSDVVGPV